MPGGRGGGLLWRGFLGGLGCLALALFDRVFASSFGFECLSNCFRYRSTTRGCAAGCWHLQSRETRARVLECLRPWWGLRGIPFDATTLSLPGSLAPVRGVGKTADVSPKTTNQNTPPHVLGATVSAVFNVRTQ
jgi:hypothetical protein